MNNQKLYSRGTIFRIITDIVIVAVALFVVYMFRLLMETVQSNNEIAVMNSFEKYIIMYLRCLPVVIILNLVTFHFFGFYSRSRYYTGRYKLICVFQAVAILI